MNELDVRMRQIAGTIPGRRFVQLLLVVLLAVLVGGCQTQKGVYLRSSGAESIPLDASSQSLPDGTIDYRVAPLDEVVVDVHRGNEAHLVADFGDTVFADFSLRTSQYRVVPGDVIGLSLQFESAKDFELVVQPDGSLMLPKIGASVSVDGLTLDDVRRLATARYAKVMTRPDITVSLLKSSADRVEKLARRYEVSRDGTIVVPTLGTIDVLGKSSRDIAVSLQEKVVALYRNPVVVSVSIAEFSASDASIQPSTETGRYFRESYKISPDGSVYVRHAGRIEASGKSLLELTDAVRDALQRRYQNKIDVNVSLGGSPSMMVYVGGEVRAPGRQAFQPSSTMLQVLASAGWINETGDLTRVSLIHRVAPGKYQVYTANLQQVYQEADAGFHDLRVSPQDMIVVPRTDIANANLVVDMFIRRMLPFGTSVSYSYIAGRTTTVP